MGVVPNPTGCMLWVVQGKFSDCYIWARMLVCLVHVECYDVTVSWCGTGVTPAGLTCPTRMQFTLYLSDPAISSQSTYSLYHFAKQQSSSWHPAALPTSECAHHFDRYEIVYPNVLCELETDVDYSYSWLGGTRSEPKAQANKSSSRGLGCGVTDCVGSLGGLEIIELRGKDGNCLDPEQDHAHEDDGEVRR
jgi:hypothetical protein